MFLGRFLFFIIFLFIYLNADVIDVDTLLKDIERKSDLSEKTKLENSGSIYIFTRDDIKRMQAKYLKDLLKSTTPIGYSENRYAIVNSSGYMFNTVPFASSDIKLFIDNQEILSGIYDSGLASYGDIDLGFVEHVEIYVYSPTYEFTTEESFMIIRLYTKKAQKDEGGTLELNIGSYDSNRVSGYYSKELDNEWSYLNYISFNDDKRKKYKSFDTKVSRDKKVTHIFSSFYNDKHNVFVDISKQHRDTFLSASIDGTPSKAYLNGSNLHIGYDAKIENFSYLMSYTYIDLDTYFEDDVIPIIKQAPVSTWVTKDKGFILTSKAQYKYKTKKNRLVFGIKYRLKKFTQLKNELNYVDILEYNGDREQNIFGSFVENYYAISSNSLLTAGIQVSSIYNKHSYEDHILTTARLGYTYTQDNFVSKFILSNIETVLEQYLVNSIFVEPKKHPIQNTIGFLIDTKYNLSNNEYEFIFDIAKMKNYILPKEGSGSLLYSYEDDITALSLTTSWKYLYNRYDKLFISFTYRDVFNMPYENQSRLTTYFGTLRNLNSLGKFDFFNEIIFDRENTNNKNYFDYSAGILYHEDSYNIALKGENIFNKAKSILYTRFNPKTFEAQSPLEISTIDQKITLSLEYKF